MGDEQPGEPSLFSEPDPEPEAFEQDLPSWEKESQEGSSEVEVIEEPDIEEPISVNTEGDEEREPVVVEPGLLPVEDRAAGSLRFAWIIVVLILGLGLFWAIRAAWFQSGQNPIASNAAAETHSEDKPAAIKAEADTTKAEPERPAYTELLPSSKGPAAIEAKDRSGKRGPTAEVLIKGKGVEKRLFQPEKRAVSPPSVSKVASDPTAPLSLPSVLKESGLGRDVDQKPPPEPEKPRAEGLPTPKVIRRSSDVLQNTAIVRSRPVYPEEAKKEKIKGPVTVEVTIDEEGSVVAARPISGPGQLHDSALAAARRWKWLPARLDRSRARVVGTITLEFRE